MISFFISFLFLVLMIPYAMAAGSGAFRVEVPDAVAAGMGSAFVGQADSSAAVYYNPAGLTQLDSTEMKMGGAWIQPKTKNKTDGKEMEIHNYGIPHFYIASDLGTEKLAFGVGVTSYFGLGTDWEELYQHSSRQMKIENKNLMIVTAYQITEAISLGVSLDVDDSKIEKKKKIPNAYGGGDFYLKGDDVALGYRLSMMYHINEAHQIGIIYRSEIKHKYKGHIFLTNSLNPVLDGVDDGYAKIRLPQSIVLGYSFKPNDRWTFNADIEWMDWTSFKEEVIAPTWYLGADSLKTPREWEDVWSYAVGFEYKATQRLRLRGGYHFHESPIPDATWDVGLPDADSHTLTIGAGYQLTKNLTADIALGAMFLETRTINTTKAQTNGYDGKYTTSIALGYLTLTYKF